MELRQLKYFLVTAKLNNMTEASRQLHVSQPSLSNAVKSLEGELGTSLFDRYGKRIELNETGRYFASRVEAALDVLNEAVDVVVKQDSERSTRVNVTLGIPLGNSGKLVRAFSDAYPEVSLHIGYPSSRAFEGQTIDIHLFGSSINIEDTNVIKLGYEPYVLIVSKDDPLAGKGEVALSEVSGYPFILTEPSEIYDDTINMCHQAGFDPKVAFETQIFSEAINMVEAGLGCAVAARFTWMSGMSDKVSMLRIANQHYGRNLYAKFPEGLEPSESTWKFIDFLQDYSESLVKPTASDAISKRVHS
ncbi:MAG: LysR family transcriptional regulator [Eggerthellaceae bacterium]